MTPEPRLAATLNIALDHDSPLSLQEQIRRKIIDDIALGILNTGSRLPSSRKLGQKLKVSRNTVILVYDRLVADGHLISRDRRGLFVRDHGLGQASGPLQVSGPGRQKDDSLWRTRLLPSAMPKLPPALPPDWDHYPFPLIDGPFDRALFPVMEWREASRRTLSVPEINIWARHGGDADDPMLIDELRRKVLPQSGISARSDEILITTGAQQALSLLCALMLEDGMRVVMENPGPPELRLLLQRKRVHIDFLDVDESGMAPDMDRLDAADMIFVSPSHQRPTGATLSEERRQALLELARQKDVILVENDCKWQTGLAASSPPALRGTSGGESVLYTATLAQPLAPAIRLGVLVAPAPVIRAARDLRKITARQPALNLQRTFAHMLALGHYTAVLRRLEESFAERMVALRDALNHYLPTKISILPTSLGTSAWITGPEALDARQLGKRAEARGVLIEPVQGYFARAAPLNVFRLGITGLPQARIREAVSEFAAAFRETLAPVKPDNAFDPARALVGRALKRACVGATLLCKTVYGDPCTITLERNGVMQGRAGFANEESDQGRWWVDGDFWCRQWREWSYGEIGRFKVVISGERIQWFHEDGHLVDWAIIVRRPGRKI